MRVLGESQAIFIGSLLGRVGGGGGAGVQKVFGEGWGGRRPDLGLLVEANYGATGGRPPPPVPRLAGAGSRGQYLGRAPARMA